MEMPLPGQAPVLLLDVRKSKSRMGRLGENLPQPAEKDLQAAPEFLEALTHREVSFERGVPFFAEHNTPASEVKKKGTHRFQGYGVNLHGNLDPYRMLFSGWNGFRFLWMLHRRRRL
jgi:hypothetical protein